MKKILFLLILLLLPWGLKAEQEVPEECLRVTDSISGDKCIDTCKCEIDTILPHYTEPYQITYFSIKTPDTLGKETTFTKIDTLAEDTIWAEKPIVRLSKAQLARLMAWLQNDSIYVTGLFVWDSKRLIIYPDKDSDYHFKPSYNPRQLNLGDSTIIVFPIWWLLLTIILIILYILRRKVK